LDETALRRESWREGVPVTLCDGQVWHLPRPVMEYYYLGDDPAPRSSAGLGREVERIIDGLFDAEDDFERQTYLTYRLARALLSINYDLADDDFAVLLRRYPEGHEKYDANVAMWRVVQQVGLGIVPKA